MTRWVALVLFAFAAGCSASPMPTQFEVLYEEMRALYPPLEECVDDKVALAGLPALADELVGTPALEGLMAELIDLFAYEDELVKPILDAAGQPEQQAFLLIQGLREHPLPEEDPVPGQMAYVVPSTHLSRNVAADIALAGLPSVQCTVPEGLQAKVEANRAAERLIELASASLPFEDCVIDRLKSEPGLSERMPSLLVAGGLDADLQAQSRRYLGSSVDVATLDMPGRVEAARTASAELAAYGGGAAASQEPISEQVQRKMAVIDLMRTMALAAGADCRASENLLAWMEHLANEAP